MLQKQSLILTFLSVLVSAHAVAGTMPAKEGGRFIAQSKAGQWKVSKVLGLRIYNENNENIGHVTELLLDDAGRIQSVVISVGGFLGVGKRDIAVPFSEIRPPSVGSIKSKEEAAAQDSRKKGATSQDGAATDASKLEVGTPAFGVLKITNDELKAAPEFKYVQ